MDDAGNNKWYEGTTVLTGAWHHVAITFDGTNLLFYVDGNTDPISSMVHDATLREIKHIRGSVRHPQTQGKIERYHRSMKNVIKLDVYCSPMELERALKKFVHYYNYERYHESLNNVTPADMYYGQAVKKIERRKRIKQKTLRERRENYVRSRTASKFIPTGLASKPKSAVGNKFTTEPTNENLNQNNY